MIDRVDGDELRAATGDDPLVRAVVLGGRITGPAWSGFGAYMWRASHRHEPSLTGIGPPDGAARLLEQVIRVDREIRHVSLPKGWIVHVTPGLVERRADWDWFWTEMPPEPRPHSGEAKWLKSADEADVRDLLEKAMPDAVAWPGDARVRRWAGIRDTEQRLVACAADTSLQPAVGHLSSVATAADQRRRGYAAALMAWVTARFWDEGVELVTLGMYADNVAARRLYERLGFTRAHEFTAAGIAAA